MKFVEISKTWGEYVSDNMKLVYIVEWKYKCFKNTQSFETVVCEVSFPDGKLYFVDTVTESDPLIDFIDALIFDTLQEAVNAVDNEFQDSDTIKVIKRKFLKR